MVGKPPGRAASALDGCRRLNDDGKHESKRRGKPASFLLSFVARDGIPQNVARDGIPQNVARDGIPQNVARDGIPRIRRRVTNPSYNIVARDGIPRIRRRVTNPSYIFGEEYGDNDNR